MNHGLDTDTEVFCYEQEFYPLSNFSSFAVQFKGWHFPTVEHAYHWSRFDCVGGAYLQASVRMAKSAHAAFTIAQVNKGMQRPFWNDEKCDVMRSILTLKLEQHEYVRTKLRQTGTRTIVENSWRDSFWGWGPNRDGQNMLGKIWMELREKHRSIL